MRSEEWLALLWIVGFGGYFGVIIMLYLSFGFSGLIFWLFGSHFIILPMLFYIQKKINQARESEEKSWIDMAGRYQEGIDKRIREQRRDYLRKMDSPKETREDVEKLLSDWEVVEEEMK